MKKCSKCGVEKKLEMFHKDKRKKDGLRSQCKNCYKEYQKRPEVIKRCKDYQREYHKEYWERNGVKERQKELQNRPETKIRRKEMAKKYENKPEVIKYRKEYKNRPEIRERRNNRRNKRYKEDLNYKLSMGLRIRLNSAVKGNYKAGSAVHDLGCTIAELKIHLEKQFKPGMTWDNHILFGWHIDHRSALSTFDLTNREQFLKACHYTNLQPMWWKENISKGKKLVFDK